MILPEDLIPKGQEKYFVPVARDLTRLEELQHQIKFCCYRKQAGFADIVVVILAGAIIFASGLVLEGIRTVTEDELPDGWSYDQTIMVK